MNDYLFMTGKKRMAGILLLSLLMFCMISAAASAAGCLIISQDGTTVTGTDGTCTVVTAADFEGATRIANKTMSSGVFYNSRATLTSIEFPSGLTQIGDYAFYKCTELTGSLTIPNSVISIGGDAFNGCSGLTGSLTIGNRVTSIGLSAFAGCSGLTGSLTIPSSVTSIGRGAFNGCKGFTGSLTIPDSITSIGQSVFSGCSGLTGSLTIPSSVTSIGVYAFKNCRGFTGSLTIGNNVTSIGDEAFSGCSGFTGSLTIPNSVTSIGDSAFSGCSGFTGSLTIGNNVTSIAGYAFQNCSGFTGSLTIPNSVTSIGNSAFRYCSGFTGSLTIGDGVTTISNSLFSGCSGFTGSLTIGDSVTSIGSYAFYGCSGLTGSLIIPNSVTTIEDSAFRNANNLDGILFTNKTATVRNDVFTDSSPVYLYADSSWINNGGGTKVPFIDTITVAPASLTFEAGNSDTVTITPNIAVSAQYIPSVTYTSAIPQIAAPAAASTGQGVLTNSISGIANGTTTITITAAQVGSDIFGAANVPAVPSVTVTVTVANGNDPVIPTTGGDGQTGISLEYYETAVYANPVVDASGNTALTITNTHYPELISVTVIKVWDDDDNRDYVRPTALCMTLTAAADTVSEEVWNQTLTASNATSGDPNEWRYIFEDLVKFYDGNQIAYSVAEDEGACAAQVTKTAANCEISGGKWENNTCTAFSLYDPNSQQSNTPEPSEPVDQASCEAASRTWVSAVCTDTAYTSQEDCEGASETWTAAYCAAN